MPVMMLMTVLMAAPGDLYRCPTADGHLHVQGQPCKDAREQPFEADSISSNPRLLSDWLKNLESDPGRQRRAPVVGRGEHENHSPTSRIRVHAENSPGEPLWPLPRSEENLASCSIQFYRCAAQPGKLMDLCVNQIPRCASRSLGACCQGAYIDRFATLRASRWSRQSATRTALLGD